MASFDAVLFDFGGVFTPSPLHGLRAAAEGMGIPPDVAFRIVFGGYDEDTDHPWHRLERGEVPIEDALAAIGVLATEAGHVLDPIAMLMSGFGGSIIRDDVVALVRDVRAAGLRTAIITNNIKEFSAGWRALLPVEELFDLVVDSSEEGVRKPDPRIFELALERLGVTAQRSVFLDDAPGNVVAARALGLHAIEVAADHAEAVTALRALLPA